MRVLAAVALLVFAPALPAQGDDKPRDPFDELHPSVSKVDVPALIRVRTDRDVERVRKELIAFVWKNDGRLPTASEVARTDADVPKQLAASAASAVKLTVALPGEFKSVVYHYRPKKPAKKLAIFHQGHDHNWGSGGGIDTAAFLLGKGYDVLAMQMPLFGDNRKFAPMGVGSHNDLAKLATRDLEPIRLFLEPVAVALNHAVKQLAPDDVVTIGLSGGGWTTTLYAAIDPRVRLSFPVAGTLPDYLRVGRPGDRGDWEQYHPDLYKVANYLDLYVLGASGPGRRQRQVLNKYDSCCFWGVGYRTYEKPVRDVTGKLSAAAFDVYLDESHRSHLVSPEALKKAIGPLLDEPRPN